MIKHEDVLAQRLDALVVLMQVKPLCYSHRVQIRVKRIILLPSAIGIM